METFKKLSYLFSYTNLGYFQLSQMMNMNMNYQKSPNDNLKFISPTEAGENVLFSIIYLIF